MSSYIVENETINRIVNFCYWVNDECLKYSVHEELKKVNIVLSDGEIRTDKQVDKVLKDFGKSLLTLNAMAVHDRYGDNTQTQKDIKEAVAGYEYKDTPKEERQDEQVLRSIHCFLYQCSEGDIDTLPLFKTIEAIGLLLSNHIINEIPAYKKAKWG